ncbi:anti-CBASS protein Acb1 family protein [Shinella sp.]|uniref:anti-CBASS protein Acb1 family protein n=1 Tax=Shinella sp. TaxID=1870904 RepID=UPI003D2A2C8A
MGEVITLRANDSLRSVVAGLGDPLRDKAATTFYGFQQLDPVQLSNIYRSNWLGKKIINIPAMDAVRKGRDWQAEQDQIELIEAEEKRLGFWNKLLEVKTKARLWGGAALLIGTGETDLMKPLEAERIGKGGIKYLTVLSRRDVTTGEIEQDVLSEYFGRPGYYEVTGRAEMVRIHPSRLAVFLGAPHADDLIAQSINQGWGDSVLEAVYTAVRNADATAANIASLVFEANVDVFRVPDFMASLSDPEYRNRLMERFTLAATAKGVNKALILDKEEEYDRKQISFAQLPEVMQTFLQMVSGAADIPVTRLLGQSPAGMSATGESDMLNYYDLVSSIQSLEMTPALYRLDECLIRSALGSRPPEIFYSWAPLKQMTEKELAEIGKVNAEAASTFNQTGLFTAEELRTVVGNQLVESGFYPGLDQAMAETGNGWEKEFEEAKVAEAEAAAAAKEDPRQAQDAAPRTLYVRRDVINAAEIIAWAKGQGFKTTLPADDLHVTITYSRTPVDWMEMGSTWEDEVKIPRGGARLMEKFGEARVLLFNSNMLRWRHDEMVDKGASWDHPEYQPHITISYDPDAPDLADVEPYQGEIVLGPEIFEEVKEDWASKIKES